MAKKKGGRRMDIVRKVFRGVARGGAYILLSGPVTFPALKGVQDGLAAGAEAGFETFVFEATGYNMNANAIDSAKVQQVVIRDVVLVGGGLFLRWIGRRL